jgi:hypothetical protein
MDGISPTLAFAVLLFGLSDDARNTTIDAESAAAVEAGCPIVMMTGDPTQSATPESWTEAFWSSAVDAPTLPDVMDPKWADAPFPEIEPPEPAGDVAPAASAYGADPVVRRAVPVSASEPVADPDVDPCVPER